MRLMFDTHAVLWWLQGGGGLSPAQVQLLEKADATGEAVGLSIISFWEIAKLVEHGRIDLGGSIDVVFDEIEESASIAVLPLTPRITLESTRLGPAFHRDPADQLIAATSRVLGLRLITSDERLRRSGAVAVV